MYMFLVPYTSSYCYQPDSHLGVPSAPRRSGVYDQMEQLFTYRKVHFFPTEILGVFWKAPQIRV